MLQVFVFIVTAMFSLLLSPSCSFINNIQILLSVVSTRLAVLLEKIPLHFKQIVSIYSYYLFYAWQSHKLLVLVSDALRVLPL